MAYPEWVEKNRLQGCEVKCISGKYYLYKLKSRWDSSKGKAVKISGEYLGAITEAGFIPKRVSTPISAIYVVKEYGASAYLMSISEDIHKALANSFETRTAESIYVAAILRVMGESSFKRMEDSYQTSYISEIIPNLSLSGQAITALLEYIGRRRDRITEVMRDLSCCAMNIIVDGTRMTSFSKEMMFPAVGYSSGADWDPKVNIMYVFERAELPQPVFYRCVQGNIPDVTAMKLTIEAMEREAEVTVVADTGFADVTNYALLSQYGMKYIIPLKRNSAELTIAELGNRANFSTAFTYNTRPVTSYQLEREDYKILVFRDEEMRYHEMSDFITRLEKKNQSIHESKNKSNEEEIDIGLETLKADPRFGVIIMRTNTEFSPKEVYETYKMREAIEQCFDTLKNTLSQDHSYMHSDASFEAWCFINHIALILAYRILNIIKQAGLTSTYSLRDIMVYLSHIQKIKIGPIWKTAEYTSKAQKVCDKLGFKIDYGNIIS